MLDLSDFENFLNNINHLGVFINLFLIFIWEIISYTWNQYSRAEFIHRLSHRFAKENILSVKVFQAIALNNNLIDEAFNNELLAFTDSVPYSDEDIDFEMLADIKRDYNLRRISDCPINAGMISLVYKAATQDKFVIIKMKRKNVESRLYDACEQFLFLNWVLSFVPIYTNMNLNSTIKNIIAASITQLSFDNEIENTEEMRRACRHLEYVKIPEIYKEVTQRYPNAIMMEYINGKHISKVDKEDYDIYAKQVLKFGFVTAFMRGITHADLHAGNILFLKDPKYKIVPIDFGLVIRMNNEELKETIIDVATDLFTSDPHVCAEKMISVLLNPPNLKKTMHEYYYCELVYIISDMLSETLCKKGSTDQLRIYEFFVKLNRFLSSSYLKNLKIEPNEDFMKLQSAIAMANGISITLCKNNYVEVANRVLDDLFHLSLFMKSG